MRSPREPRCQLPHRGDALGTLLREPALEPVRGLLEPQELIGIDHRAVGADQGSNRDAVGLGIAPEADDGHGLQLGHLDAGPAGCLLHDRERLPVEPLAAGLGVIESRG
jgi:hypothetical protein